MLKSVFIGLMHILRIATVLLLIVQMTFSLIYALPATPIQTILEPWLDATIGTYFYQNWDFFAPNPTDTDYALLVRPLTNREEKVAQMLALPNDGWYDLSSPVWTHLQGNRFAAYVKLANAITNATSGYDSDHTDKASLAFLIKFASAFCKDIGKTNASYVALIVRERHSIPWPDGGTPGRPLIKTKFLGIYPINRNVENIHLYQL